MTFREELIVMITRELLSASLTSFRKPDVNELAKGAVDIADHIVAHADGVGRYSR